MPESKFKINKVDITKRTEEKCKHNQAHENQMKEVLIFALLVYGGRQKPVKQKKQYQQYNREYEFGTAGIGYELTNRSKTSK